MKRGLGWLCLAGWLAAPALARAEDPQPIATSHKGQFGVHAQMGLGYRVLFPYHEEFCGIAGKSVCSGRAPFFVELGLSYGVSDSIELLADVRLGTERDFAEGAEQGPRALVVAPGIKVYIDNDGGTKFFSTLQLAIDFTDFAATTSGLEDATDFGVRNVNGVLFDISKQLGFYFHFGETIGFARWLRFEIDGGLGIQGRFP